MTRIVIWAVGGCLSFLFVVCVVVYWYQIEDYVLNSIELTRFEPQGDRLIVSGEINELTLGQFEKVFADNPGITTLVLRYISGSIDDATNVRLGYRVRSLGLSTFVPHDGEIYSGGVDLFLAGVSRSIRPGAILGVHSWSDEDQDGADYPKDSPEHDEERDYVEAMLGNDRFYWYMLSAAPSEDMHVMTLEEIETYKLLTK